MKKEIINVGIFAHVDAGKTTITENILYETRVIRSLGRVDRGSTRTDSMNLEKERGISIRSAATSFTIDGVKVNLIDTPGHIDFISEVERVLHVLDCAVLVISGKEGVQTQTRVLWKALQELRIPTIIFVNKLDRLGVNLEKIVVEMKEMLSPNIIMLQECQNEGTQDLEIINKDINEAISVLAEFDEDMLDAYVESHSIREEIIREKMIKYTQKGYCFPVYLGSALMNIGVSELLQGIVRTFSKEKLPIQPSLSGVVFKIEKDKHGVTVHFVRVFEGILNNREEVYIYNKESFVKVKNVKTIVNGEHVAVNRVLQGDIGVVYGLEDVEIGDIIGKPSSLLKEYKIPKSVFTAIIRPVNDSEKNHLVSVLTELSKQDPLLKFTKNPLTGELAICLIGQIQKEVIHSLLKEEYSLDVEIGHPKVVYMESPTDSGVYYLEYKNNQPYPAGVELKVEPLPRGSGVQFQSEVSTGYIVQTMQTAIEESVRETLKEGLKGWEVTDVLVTFTNGYFNSVDSTASSFRKATPMALMEALQLAGTKLIEPRYHFTVLIDEGDLGKVSYDLRSMKAKIEKQEFRGSTVKIFGTMPVITSMNYRIELASQTKGKGVFETEFAGYFDSEKPLDCKKERTTVNPLFRGVYIRSV